MTVQLYCLHLEVGRLVGEERTCGNKKLFPNEAAAAKAAYAHNHWYKRKHDVEAYPCYFCRGWHIGGIMPVEVLESIVLESMALEVGKINDPESPKSD